jgi:hypothetical protein
MGGQVRTCEGKGAWMTLVQSSWCPGMVVIGWVYGVGIHIIASTGV